MTFNAAIGCIIAIALVLGAVGTYLTRPSQKHSD